MCGQRQRDDPVVVLAAVVVDAVTRRGGFDEFDVGEFVDQFRVVG